MEENTQQAEAAVKLLNKYGLHARPATLFVEQANQFECDVLIVVNDTEVNGKSIMGIMMLGAEAGTLLTIRCNGKNAQDACQALVELVESKFGES